MPSAHDGGPAICRHFGECGGCRTQDVAYAAQLAQKEAELRELFAPYWQHPIPVEPSPRIWHYRNKMDLTFGRKYYPEPPPPDLPRETVLGLKRKGRWYWTLDIEECRIGPEGMDGLLAATRQWARDHALSAFSSKSKDGFLRILLVREGCRTGQRMVVLITNEGPFEPGPFVQAVQSSFPADSIHHATFRGFAEIAAADEIELLHGTAAIEERLDVPDAEGECAPDAQKVRPLRFRISPFSFFQTNTLATERLYGLIRARVRALAPTVLYDLYGGSGGIAFACADLVESAVSVESVEEATADGRHNAAVNDIGNVTFLTQHVEHYLRDLRERQATLPPDCAVVVDPPRAGLHPKALRRLVELNPPAILYVACKPTVLVKQDLPGLAEQYHLVDVRAVDLFPHTPHVEVLAQFASK
ncbi:MAG: class I SAM-dependent RNA methyltransferase [Candidatus Hydrogenedentes bacterium]|nr:class I SAM-dependent RNA methyltransferase [Candidatus Hydrogenedentota bacterium]